MKTLTVIGLLWIAVASHCLAADNYRDYLRSVDGFERWFRIGTFTIKDGEKDKEIDLYYADGNRDPQDSKPMVKTHPNSFDLFCVWRDSEGEWTHKEIYGGFRVTFLRVKDKLKDGVLIQLEGTSMMTFDFDEAPEEWERKGKLHEKINAPFGVVVSFVSGKPKATRQAEQGDARRPATAVDSKAEGSEKPKPKSEGRSQ